MGTKQVSAQSGPITLSATVLESDAEAAQSILDRVAALQELHRQTPPAQRDPVNTYELFAMFDQVAALERRVQS